MVSSKATVVKANVRVYEDKGSLALRFSTKYNPIFQEFTGFSGRQKCMGLKMADTQQNWKKAQAIALQIEADLEHSDWVKLFDPTFAKYGIGDAKFAQKMGELVQLPQAKAAMTVGEMWEDYLLWKEGQVAPTTFKAAFLSKYSNAIKGLKWDKPTKTFTNLGTGIYDLPLDGGIGEKAEQVVTQCVSRKNAKDTLNMLREAYDRAMKLGKIPPTNNPFVIAFGETNNNQIYEHKQDETGVWRDWWWFEDISDDEYLKDTRYFTLIERDTIIKAFYESNKAARRNAAPLIEFLFLTGCRHGEAFGLRWKDVSFERGYVRFSKSFDKQTGTTKCTKTDTIRMFKLYPKLTELLLRIQANSSKTGKNDLVFTLMNGSAYGSDNISSIWLGRSYDITLKTGEEVKRFYPGIITTLAEQNLVGQYLSPYSTRHTFITLQAQAGTSLPLLAAICGNTVDVILRHYLGIDKSAEPTNL